MTIRNDFPSHLNDHFLFPIFLSNYRNMSTTDKIDHRDTFGIALTNGIPGDTQFEVGVTIKRLRKRT
ncbi:hypothetical protein WS87_31180 [Burkholderia sp. MSMB0856]|nr:hypothetical protein WS87_31180 [Burkholderia sp. MSMB0856]KVH27956.1 hypothetical protein WS87_29815 [Burkholderia sp. MSMB0856]